MEIYKEFVEAIKTKIESDTYFVSMSIFTDSDLPLQHKVRTQLSEKGICIYLPYPEFSRDNQWQVKLMQPIIIYENPTVNYDSGSYSEAQNKNGADVIMRIWGNLEQYVPSEMWKPLMGTSGGSVVEDSGTISHMLTIDTGYTLQMQERI